MTYHLRRVIQRAERTLGEYDTFEKDRPHGGRRRRVTVNVEEQLLKDVLEHPDICARNLSLQYNLSCFTILRILHENNLRAYHIIRVPSALVGRIPTPMASGVARVLYMPKLRKEPVTKEPVTVYFFMKDLNQILVLGSNGLLT